MSPTIKLTLPPDSEKNTDIQHLTYREGNCFTLHISFPTYAMGLCTANASGKNQARKLL